VPTARSLITYSVALIVIFAASAVTGYVYERSPERDVIEVVIDRSSAPERDAEFASGTVASVDNGTLSIAADFTTFEVALDGVALEELRPLADPTGFAAGTALNLGGERTAVERVISGVVLFQPEVTP
jgi:hypothetical protein